MKINFLSLVGICLAVPLSIFSQTQTDSTLIEQLDEIVITDTKFNIKRKNSGKVISLITQKDLVHLKGASVADVLNSVAGVEVNGAKSVDGQNLNYYIRGGRNRQVLIIIDGVQLTDPSQIANDYDLRLLQTEQIESIEILKGASSTLYGSGAATAVINIKLIDASSKSFSLNYSSVVGTNQSQDDDNYRAETFKNSAIISGNLNKFNYKLGVSNTFSEGMSAIASGVEDDSYSAVHTNVQFGYKISKNVDIRIYYNNDFFEAEFDDGFGLTDANNLSTTKQHRAGIISEFNYNNGNLTLNAAFNSVDREIESSFPSIFNGETFVGDIFNKYNFNETFFLTAGTNYIKNSMESFSIPFGETNFEKSIDSKIAEFNIIDPYLNLLYVSDIGININTGLRLNNHSEYGSHLVYSVNPSYRFNFKKSQLKVLASYSTAYITPSLFQLFEPTFGNENLDPEENRTIEVGLAYNCKIWDLSLVYFNRKEENFIDFVDLGDFVFQYRNIDEDFAAHGLEFIGSAKVTDDIIISSNVTYTDVEESLNLRIPEIKANASISYKISERLLSRLDYQYNDDRNDRFTDPMTFESQFVTLESYSLFNLYLNYELKKNKVNVFANFNNILNADYQELFGYTTKGRNLNLGININL